jgi:LmbE family N-acetylglucosaminyl deacetylase
MTHVFLAPHLDDTTLSCGGRMHQLAQAGETVQVVVIMAGDPPDPLPESPLIRELHDRWKAGNAPIHARRQEERQAAARLGATVTFMDLPDCVYRTRPDGTVLYPAGDDDLFGPVKPDDPARVILQGTPHPAAQTLYVPLGVGGHVDHILVRQWAETSAESIIYYEDYPYAEQAAAITDVIESRAGRLQPEVITLTDDDFTAKWQAVAEYHSQISTFWPGIKQMRSRLYRYMTQTGNGTLAERYWRDVSHDQT